MLPKNPLRQAMDYALSQCTALNRYVDDGRLAIDHMAAEQPLRGPTIAAAIGCSAAASAAAVHYSLVATCARHEVEPFAYLRDVLTRFPVTLPQAIPDELRALLPDRWQPAAA